MYRVILVKATRALSVAKHLPQGSVIAVIFMCKTFIMCEEEEEEEKKKKAQERARVGKKQKTKKGLKCYEEM